MPIMVLEVKNMRLFIAVNFDQELKHRLTQIAENLKDLAKKGNFTRQENFHLTLVFIGETTQVDRVKEALKSLKAPAFTLNLSGLGHFPRKGGHIYWVGVEKHPTLLAIYEKLYRALTAAGFKLEKRPYKPHITLGREVVLKPGFNGDEFISRWEPLSCQVTKISLMKSERIGGKLVYTEIAATELNG